MLDLTGEVKDQGLNQFRVDPSPVRQLVIIKYTAIIQFALSHSYNNN